MSREMQATRPRILIVTRNLPPMVGGMERLIWNCIESISQWADTHVIGPPGSSSLLPDGVPSTEIAISPLPRFFFLAMVTVLQKAVQFRPDWIFAGSGLTAPFAMISAKICSAKSIAYLHGLDVEADNLVYRALWVRSFRHLTRVIVNSGFTHALALKASVADNRVHTLHPGVSLPNLADAEARRAAFRRRYNISHRPVMLYVGRITTRKGLAVFVEKILPDIVEQLPSVFLIVIGDEPKRSAKQLAGQTAIVKDSLNKLRLDDHVRFIGELPFNSPELSDAYFAADVHIFPVQERKGDNEGFGMVAVEAAAHGLPTVVFNAGGVSDAVAEGESGRLISPGDHQGFAQQVVEMLQITPNDDTRNRCQKFATKFAWSSFGNKLKSIFQEPNQ